MFWNGRIVLAVMVCALLAPVSVDAAGTPEPEALVLVHGDSAEASGLVEKLGLPVYHRAGDRLLVGAVTRPSSASAARPRWWTARPGPTATGYYWVMIRDGRDAAFPAGARCAAALPPGRSGPGQGHGRERRAALHGRARTGAGDPHAQGAGCRPQAHRPGRYPGLWRRDRRHGGCHHPAELHRQDPDPGELRHPLFLRPRVRHGRRLDLQPVRRFRSRRRASLLQHRRQHPFRISSPPSPGCSIPTRWSLSPPTTTPPPRIPTTSPPAPTTTAAARRR